MTRKGAASSPKAITRNLKYGGYRALFNMNWISASGFYLSLAGLAGAVTLILGMYSDGKLSIKSDKDSNNNEKKKKYLVPGLQNLGNNCFLNVILQALAGCSGFQSFIDKIVQEYNSLQFEEEGESFPLMVSLASLLQELSEVAEERVVLSPRKVMQALELYIQNFSLTRQQDASEAFLHLLSSLREESSDIYQPAQITSVANVLTSPTRVVSCSNIEDDQVEYLKWQKHFLGPFDGILGSTLICQSCSSQISLDFQFFHSLPVPLVCYDVSTIMPGCTLEDCLEQFFVAEQIENYRCSRCCHMNITAYLSARGATEIEVERFKKCNAQDPCDCQSHLGPEVTPLLDKLSLAMKKLNIARSPKILCIQLQRATVNEYGEPIKLQGHVAFPLILDTSPFLKSGVDFKSNRDMQGLQMRLRYQNTSAYNKFSSIQAGVLRDNIFGRRANILSIKNSAATGFGSTSLFKFPPGELVAQAGGCLETTDCVMSKQADDKDKSVSESSPPEAWLYKLVSVIEHFGRAGSGHYTVYRSAKTEFDTVGLECEAHHTSWFCISDSDVHPVSEEEVLDAEASLLFYERITEV